MLEIGVRYLYFLTWCVLPALCSIPYTITFTAFNQNLSQSKHGVSRRISLGHCQRHPGNYHYYLPPPVTTTTNHRQLPPTTSTNKSMHCCSLPLPPPWHHWFFPPNVFALLFWKPTTTSSLTRCSPLRCPRPALRRQWRCFTSTKVHPPTPWTSKYFRTSKPHTNLFSFLFDISTGGTILNRRVHTNYEEVRESRHVNLKSMTCKRHNYCKFNCSYVVDIPNDISFQRPGTIRINQLVRNVDACEYCCF